MTASYLTQTVNGKSVQNAGHSGIALQVVVRSVCEHDLKSALGDIVNKFRHQAAVLLGFGLAGSLLQIMKIIDDGCEVVRQSDAKRVVRDNEPKKQSHLRRINRPTDRRYSSMFWESSLQTSRQRSSASASMAARTVWTPSTGSATSTSQSGTKNVNLSSAAKSAARGEGARALTSCPPGPA